MQFWVDSYDLQAITDVAKLVPLTGVTTNPTIIRQSGREQNELVAMLLDTQSGHVAVQITSDTVESICTQSRALSTLCERIIVKIPATAVGIEAMQELLSEDLPMMATALYTPQQYIQVSALGIPYAAFYFQRALVHQLPAMCYLEEMIQFKQSHQLTTKILIAGCPLEQLSSVLLKPIDALTLKPPVYAQYFATCEQTIIDTKAFNNEPIG